jgi:hypothetical protein
MIVNSKPLVKIDYKRPPAELVIDLINKDNGTKFTTEQITFGIPKLTLNGRHNTEVIVKATARSYFTGQTKLKYNRVDIADIPGDRSTVFEINTSIETQLSDLIPAIDARYDLALTPEDYVNIPLPAIGAGVNEQDVVILKAALTSLVFINELNLQITRAGQVLLSTVINHPMLIGLFYNKPALHALIDY